MTRAPCPQTHRVDAHFAGKTSPAEEAEMRRHLLEGCPTCHFRYTRLAMVAKVQPGAGKAEDRIAAGLGFGRPVPPWRRALVFGLPVAAAFAAIFLLARGREDHFASRGLPAASSELRIFRVQPGGKSVPATDRIAAGDELAFAYRDGTGKRHLFVFGVDEHRHVYWFSPAWRSADDQPAAPAIVSDGVLHEIEDAVGHPYDGARLDVYALFTDHPWRVQELEAAIGRQALTVPLAFPDGILTVQHLEVGP